MPMRLVREIRAISPLIATIILIAITLVGGLIMYALFSSTTFTQSAQAMVRPEAVWLMSSPTGRHFVVNLKNVGNKPITQVNVTVLGEGTASFGISIPPGSTKFFHVNLNGSYIVGERYGALVEGKCSDGSTFALQLTAVCEGMSYPGGIGASSGTGVNITDLYQNITSYIANVLLPELLKNVTSVTAYGGYEGDYTNWVKAWIWNPPDGPAEYDLMYTEAVFAKDYLLVVYKDSSGNYRLASVALSNGSTIYLSPPGESYFYTVWAYQVWPFGYPLYNTLVALSVREWADESVAGMSFSVRGRYVLLAALGTCSKLVVLKDGVQFWESPAASDVDPDAGLYLMAGLSWSGKYVVALTDTGKLVCFKGIGTDPEEPSTTTPPNTTASLEGDYSRWIIYDRFDDEYVYPSFGSQFAVVDKDETKILLMDYMKTTARVYNILTKTLSDPISTNIMSTESVRSPSSIYNTYYVAIIGTQTAPEGIYIFKNNSIIEQLSLDDLGLFRLCSVDISLSGKYIVISGTFADTFNNGWVVLVGS